MVELVFAHFAAEGVAVDSEDLCGARLVAASVLEHALDEFLLEFRDARTPGLRYTLPMLECTTEGSAINRRHSANRGSGRRLSQSGATAR